MQIYFHSCLCSYLSRVPILVEDTVHIYIYIYIYIKQPPHFKTPPHATGIYCIYIYSVYSGYGSDVDYQVEYVNFMLQRL